MEKILYTLIVLFQGLTLLLDGISGEFKNPSGFDIVKWIAYAILLVVYLIYLKVSLTNK